MRVLVISNFYPPVVFGGYELRCADIVRQLEKVGHTCRVITSRHGMKAAQESGNVFRVLHSFWDLPNKPADLSGFLDALQEDAINLRRSVVEFEPDVISCWNFMGIGYPLAHVVAQCGVPVLWHMDDDWMLLDEPHWRLYGDEDRSKSRQILRGGYHPDIDLRPVRDIELQCVFISDFRRRRHVEAGMAVADQPVIHGGIDVELFKGEVKPQPENGKIRLLYCGALTTVKGMDTLLQAMAMLPGDLAPRCSLSVIGGGDERRLDELKLSAERLEIADRVFFGGSVEHENMPDVYRAHDVLIFPSEALEGFPLTILEGMACGLPVIATQNGGQREYLRHRENSIVVEHGSPADIATAIEELVTSPELAGRLAETGQALALERFTIGRMAEETEALLRSIAGEAM